MGDTEEEELGSKGGDGTGGKRLDPEKGPMDAKLSLPEQAEKALEVGLQDVVTCVVGNIKNGHLPSARLLLELASRVKEQGELAAEEYASFAVLLCASLKTVVGEEE